MAVAWSNWSGSIRFTPACIAEPESEALASLIQRAAETGQTVRVAGAGHSSAPLLATSGILVSLAKLQGVRAEPGESHMATIGSGVTLGDAGQALRRLGMAFGNLGDVDYQTVAGAFGTGTHGTGVSLPSVASHLIGGRLVTGGGEILPFSNEGDADLVRAMRVSLGALGVLTALRLRLVPAHRLRKREWCARIDDCVAAFDELSERYRQVDFYWYPRSDEAKLRTTDLAEHPAFAEVRQRIKERWRHIVGWRVLYRTMAADKTYLSIAYGRPTVTISLHQNATLP